MHFDAVEACLLAVLSRHTVLLDESREFLQQHSAGSVIVTLLTVGVRQAAVELEGRCGDNVVFAGERGMSLNNMGRRIKIQRTYGNEIKR
jgi:hypothetical protein